MGCSGVIGAEPCPFRRIVDYAKENCLRDLHREREWFKSRCTTLPDAIERASLSEFPAEYSEGRNDVGPYLIHGHQRRCGRAALKSVQDALEEAQKSIRQVGSFDELIRLVRVLTRDVPRIGELAAYDISERLGWFLQLEPEVVYLHSGTRDGARKICRAWKGATLEKAQLPASFQTLSCSEIETLLCVHKSDLEHPEDFDPQEGPSACGSKRKLRRC